MNISEAHNILNEWYPGVSHSIQVELCQSVYRPKNAMYSNSGPSVTVSLFYSIAVHTDVMKHAFGKPSLESCMELVKPPHVVTREEAVVEADKAHLSALEVVA